MTAQQEQVGLRETATIAFPGTEAPGTAWDLYNQMIAGIPEGVFVRDYCLGLNWSYVEADCGMGVAFTVRGGGKRAYKMDLQRHGAASGGRAVEVLVLPGGHAGHREPEGGIAGRRYS